MRCWRGALATVLLLSACEQEPTTDKPPPTLISVAGSVTPALNASWPSSCALQVGFYDIVSFYLGPAKAKALATCPVGADGAFSCEPFDFNSAGFGLISLVDDADNATSDCVAPTATVSVYCGKKDFADVANDGCGGGHGLDDKALAIGDAGTAPVFGLSRAWLSALDAQVTDAAFKGLADTGVVLNIAWDDVGQGLTDLQPYQPEPCRAGALQCRTFVLNESADAIVAGATRTTRSGAWITQVQKLDEQGNAALVPFDTAADANKPNAHGAIDCGAGAPKRCFTFVPEFPHAAGVLQVSPGGAPSGDVLINLVSTEATAASIGECASNQALLAAGVAAEVLTCR